MKLEKDRLKARVENLEISMNQESTDHVLDGSLDKSQAATTSMRLGQSAAKSQAAQHPAAASTAAAAFARRTNVPTPIPTRERYNPGLSEEYEGVG